MSRRLWVTTIVLVVFLAAIIVLSFIAFVGSLPALSVLVLVFTAVALVAINYLVINPALLENAKRDARGLCDAGQIVDPKLHDRLCGRLAKAPDDTEAAELHRKLTALREKAGKTGQK